MENKKILLEIVLIPLCVMYLIFSLLSDHETISLTFCIIFTVITSSVFLYKYIREVYIYESKYNILKILFSIYNVFLIMILILKLVFRTKLFNVLFIVFISGLLIFLFYNFIKSFIKIIKDKENLYKNIISSFLNFLSFSVIFSNLMIIL